LAVKKQEIHLKQHIMLKAHDKTGIVSIKGVFEMEHTILRKNAQYNICVVCALLRNL